jgi:NAD(P)-dependent dehydrogenase (short-subunit alcohol dehydrogenase family)
MPVDFSLDGKVAVVTGAAGGIGQAYARTLAQAGASVVVADLDTEGADAFAATLQQEGLRATGVTLDIADENSARAAAKRVTDELGGIDILVNNAAIYRVKPPSSTPLTEYPIEWWDKMMKVNVAGALICVQAFAPSMIERGGGKIVNQASAAAYTLTSGPYGVGKLALIGLTINLAKELGKHKINVNAIAPGMIEDDANRDLGVAFGPELEQQRLRDVVARKAWGPPEDLCGALLYLCSPAGDYITGQTLRVDGGWVLNP